MPQVTFRFFLTHGDMLHGVATRDMLVGATGTMPVTASCHSLVLIPSCNMTVAATGDMPVIATGGVRVAAT